MNQQQSQIKYSIQCIECFMNDIPFSQCHHSRQRKLEFIPFDLRKGCSKWLSSPQLVSIIWRGTSPPATCVDETNKTQIAQTLVSVPTNYSGNKWCGYNVKKIL